MRPGGRGLSRLVAVCAAVLVFHPVAASAQANPNPTPTPAPAEFTPGTNTADVEINLARARISQILPFDVPFAFTGKISSVIPTLFATFHEKADGTICQLPNPLPLPSTEPSHDPLVRNLAVSSRGGSVLGPTVKPDTTDWEFRLDFSTALRAKKEYCFYFWGERKIIGAEFDTFKKTAYVSISKSFGNYDDDKTTAPEMHALQQSVTDALTAAVLPNRLSPASSGPFNGPRAIAAFMELYDKVVDAQDNVLAKLRDVYGPPRISGPGPGAGSQRAVATTQLTPMLLANSPFRTALMAFLKEAGRDDVKQYAETIKALLALPVNQTGLLAVGLPAGSPPPTRLPDWEGAAAVRDQVKTLDGLVENFARVIEFFGAVIKSDELRKVAGLTVAAATNLERATRDAGSDLDAILTSLRIVATRLEERTKAITESVAKLEAQVHEQVLVTATTIGNFGTRHRWYISADVGVAVAPDIDEVFPYIGVNVYFRPINKDAPLRGFDFWRRTAFMMGVTYLSDLTTGHSDRKNLFNNRMGLIGVGARVTDGIRVSGGSLVFKSHVPNPSVDDYTLVWTPFFSLSIDWDVASTVTSWFSKNK